jgi:hypothetical protein
MRCQGPADSLRMRRRASPSLVGWDDCAERPYLFRSWSGGEPLCTSVCMVHVPPGRMAWQHAARASSGISVRADCMHRSQCHGEQRAVVFKNAVIPC